MTLKGVIIGGSKAGCLIEAATNTLLLPSTGECVRHPLTDEVVFAPSDRQKYHYMPGANGMGFWWPIKFGGPMVPYTDLVAFLQQAYVKLMMFAKIEKEE